MTTKLGASHLERRACVYVRQSTATQIREHRESTQRQYALADRAERLGWTRACIDVIDDDLGRSGTTVAKRNGFARLVDGVAKGRIGAIFAIEMSRLARSSEDWQRLLSLCAVAEVVVVDEQAIYDPADRDDKLLLDIKGTMSEAELHWLGLRLHGARKSKARRGELRLRPPTGYIWAENRLRLDPDESVQRTIRLFFERYSVEPSIWSVTRWANDHGIQLPTRRFFRDGTSELVWKYPGTTRLRNMFSNPIYAGAYVFGRGPTKRLLVDGSICTKRILLRNPNEWAVCIQDAHPGYISWEQYLKNQQKLQDNAVRNRPSARGAPREGHGLLAGLVICARCGNRARLSYRTVGRGYYYACTSQRTRGGNTCWTIPGKPIDRAVEQLFLQTMVPSELQLSLAVEREVDAQAESLRSQWRLRLEQAQYEARQAERRYKAVDPDNRVVARTLEQEWEQRLGYLEQVERDYEKAKTEHHVVLSVQDRAHIRALARDLPKVWNADTTKQADRKAMLRLVIDAISLNPIDVPRRATTVRVAWKSGAVTELEVPRPGPWRVEPRTLQRIRELAAEGVYDTRIAELLNAQGHTRSQGRPWTCKAVCVIRQRNQIQSTAPHPKGRPAAPYQREDGLYSIHGVARRFGVCVRTVRKWVNTGLLPAKREPHPYYPHGVFWFDVNTKTAAQLQALARDVRPRGRSGAHRRKPA